MNNYLDMVKCYGITCRSIILERWNGTVTFDNFWQQLDYAIL